jgi:tetratricopeptide (TPR) repeat protein
MPNRYDIFLSYPSVDRAQATALKAALEALGLSVWMDTERIDDAASIQRSITDGLARCRVLVAWYSTAYTRSRACQWELTAALIVSQAEALATRRVLVLNPEAGVGHITQTVVRDIELVPAHGGDAMAPLAQRVQAAAANAKGLLGDIRQLARPRWLGARNPRGSNRFVGRLDELWQVHSALTAGHFAIVSGLPSPGAALPLASVRGSGGMGKSLLAEEYALRFGAFWPGGLVWIDALGVSDRPEEPADALAQRREAFYLEQLGLVAMALGIDGKSIEGMNLRQLRAMLGNKLQEGGQRYLWLVDDLPTCSPAALDDWQAPSANGATLFTSRARQHEALGTLIPLGILLPDDAYALLCAGRKPHDAAEEAAARGIVQRLGGHAMAVDQARAACEQQGFTGFLKRLDQDDQQALALSRTLAGDLPNGHERDIAKTFLGSITGLNPDGFDLLTLAAQLSGAPISRDLIAASKLARLPIAAQSADEPDEAAMRAAELAAQDWADLAMHELTACSLADPAVVNPATPDGASEIAITLHTLIARVARWQLARGGDAHLASAQWREAATLVLLRTLQNADDILQHAEMVNEVHHARLLCEQVETFDQALLLARIALYDHARGRYGPARVAWQTVVTKLEHVLGAEHPDTLTSIGNLAATLQAMGDLPRARAMQEQVLVTHQRVQGAEHPATMTSMNNLASTLQAMGDLHGARAIHEKELAICQRVLGAEHPQTLISMGNLAGTLRVMGDLPGARTMQEQVLAIHQRVLGAEHSDTLTSVNNLAVTLQAMGDLHGARAMQAQALAIHQRVLGPEHPDTSVSMGNLASTLRAMGDLPGARAMQEQVLAIHQRVLGAEHPTTLISMGNLANTLQNMGDLPNARAMQEQVLATRQRVLGADHPATLTSMNNLAGTLRAMGDLPGARAMQEQVLATRQRVLGAEHPATLISTGNLAEDLRNMGNLPRARAMQEQVLAIHQRVLGAEHPDTLTSMNNLAGTLQAMGDLTGARAMHEKDLSICQRVLGAEHPDTLISMNNLARTLQAMGDLPGARAMQVHVLAICQRVLGAEHPDTVRALGNLLHMLVEANDKDSFMAVAKQYPVTMARLMAKQPGADGK